VYLFGIVDIGAVISAFLQPQLLLDVAPLNISL
jgi:hypothetical protein